MLVNDVAYRADFQCTREPTTTYLSRFAVPRGTGGFFNSHPADIPVKEQKKIADLFGWLHGGEIKAERKHAKKTVKASKERTDIHGTTDRTPDGILHENPIAEKLGEPEAQVGTPEVKSRFELAFGSIPPIANGMPKVSEGTVRGNNTPVHGTIPDEAVPEMRSADNVQSDRKQPVACVRAVFEPAMKEEYDPSYKETTAHACITCKCGKKVWYGCAKKHTSRPKYCSACTEVEKHKLQHGLAGIDPARMEEIFVKNLRREITR